LIFWKRRTFCGLKYAGDYSCSRDGGALIWGPWPKGLGNWKFSRRDGEGEARWEGAAGVGCWGCRVLSGCLFE
jgi:hypothetical protein